MKANLLAAIRKTSPTATIYNAAYEYSKVHTDRLCDRSVVRTIPLLDQARHCAEIGNIKKWEIINRAGKLVAWSKPKAA